jgi:tyrosyl-tRNA synthetase
MYHGEGTGVLAEEAFDRVFKEHKAPEDVPEVSVDLAEEVYVPGLLVELELASSAGDGRRLMDGGGVRIDGEPLQSGVYTLAREKVEGRVVQVGKRRFARPLARS